jgi:hypothetical protein
MNYGGNSQDEMEARMRLDREDRHAHLCSTWPAWSRKLDRLDGSPKQVTERDGNWGCQLGGAGSVCCLMFPPKFSQVSGYQLGHSQPK